MLIVKEAFVSADPADAESPHAKYRFNSTVYPGGFPSPPMSPNQELAEVFPFNHPSRKRSMSTSRDDSSTTSAPKVKEKLKKSPSDTQQSTTSSNSKK